MVFPAKGQTKEQQELDEFSCHKWAVDQAGVNPLNTQSAQAADLGQYDRAWGLCMKGKGYEVG